MAMALNMHFRSDGPDGWHFHTKTVKSAVGGMSEAMAQVKPAMGANLRRAVE